MIAMPLPWLDPPGDLAIAQPFWEAVAKGELVLPRCSVCARWQWYPEVSGTDCTGGTLDWQQVPLTGTLYSCTTVHRNFLPGEVGLPYRVGLIDLDDTPGPRLVAPLADDAAIDDRVHARFIPAGDHTILAFARL